MFVDTAAEALYNSGTMDCNTLGPQLAAQCSNVWLVLRTSYVIATSSGVLRKDTHSSW